MGAELEVTRAAAEAVHGLEQAADIGFELRGRGAASGVLIELRPGGHAFWPFHGSVESQVLEHGPQGKSARNLHRLLRP